MWLDCLEKNEGGAPDTQFAVNGLAKIIKRWAGAWLEVLASAFADGLSWVLAQHLFGHPQPFGANSQFLAEHRSKNGKSQETERRKFTSETLNVSRYI